MNFIFSIEFQEQKDVKGMCIKKQIFYFDSQKVVVSLRVKKYLLLNESGLWLNFYNLNVYMI